jgi:hypothetical protein
MSAENPWAHNCKCGRSILRHYTECIVCHFKNKRKDS